MRRKEEKGHDVENSGYYMFSLPEILPEMLVFSVVGMYRENILRI